MKLKPCPFCKAINWREYRYYWQLEHNPGCFFENINSPYKSLTILSKTRNKKLKAWNTRKEATP